MSTQLFAPDATLPAGASARPTNPAFARPDWGVAFDVDMDAAAATRLRMMAMAAADRVLIAGMHLDFPGFGHVQTGTEGASYRFVPMPWQTAFPASEP